MRIDPIKFARKVISSDLSLFTFSNLLVNFINFSSQLLVANILTPADIGYIKLILSVISVITIVANFGINVSILKICSENIDNREIFNRFYSGNVITTISSSIVIFITTIFFIFNHTFIDANTNFYLYIVISISIIINSIFNNYSAIFQGLRKNKEFSFINIIIKSTSIILIILFTYYFRFKGYWIAYIVSISLSLIIIVLYLKKYINKEKNYLFNTKNYFKIHFNYSKWALASNTLGQLTIYSDIFIVNILSDNKNEIGIYSFATTFVVIIKIIPATIQQYISPRFSFISDNIKEIKSKYIKYNKLIITTSFIIGIVTIIIVPFFIKEIFPKYENSIKYIILLTISVIIRNFNIINASVLFGVGKLKYNLYNDLISFSLITILSTMLFSRLNFISCALSQIVVSVIIVFISRYQVKKILNANY